MPIVDTNIIIDFFTGHHQAKDFLGKMNNSAISIITFSELLVGCNSEKTSRLMKEYIRQNHTVIPINEKIGEGAAIIRREQNIKLPDALILSTALEKDTYLITRNTKDFDKNLPYIRVPYSLN